MLNAELRIERKPESCSRLNFQNLSRKFEFVYHKSSIAIKATKRDNAFDMKKVHPASYQVRTSLSFFREHEYVIEARNMRGMKCYQKSLHMLKKGGEGKEVM